MMPYRFASVAALLVASTAFANAPESATIAEAQERLKSVIAAVKSNGGPNAAKMLMAAEDPAKCRYKDVVCLLADVKSSTLLMHTAIPKLAGSPLVGDMTDVDGVSINQQLFGPGQQGKARWETKYKFARPDTKKIVGRTALCEKVDDANVVCVSISQ